MDRLPAADPPKPGATSASALDILFAVRVTVRGCGDRLGSAGCEDGRSCAQKRVAWSFEEETRCPRGVKCQVPDVLSRALGGALRVGDLHDGRRGRACDVGKEEVVALGRRGPGGGSHLRRHRKRGSDARGAMLGLFCGVTCR
jgi:hypothetical protein